jgi:hypothetical protein
MGCATSSRRFGEARLHSPSNRHGKGHLDALIRPRGGGMPLSYACRWEAGKRMNNLHATQANEGTKIAICAKIA